VEVALSSKSIHLKSQRGDKKSFEDFVMKILAVKANNSYVSDAEPPSASVLKRLKRIFIEMKGDYKTTARSEVFEDIRNPLSLCGALSVVNENTSHEMFFSSDDVSVVLNGWDEKPAVITTKEAKRILDEQNIGVSTVSLNGSYVTKILI
jgi:hypothetical protein